MILLKRILAVLGLFYVLGVQADFIVDFFSKYYQCSNGLSDCQPGEQCVSCGHSATSGELTRRPIGNYCSGPKVDIPLCKNHVFRGRIKTTAYADDFLTCLVATCAETRQDASEEEEKPTELLKLRVFATERLTWAATTNMDRNRIGRGGAATAPGQNESADSFQLATSKNMFSQEG